ncbi:SusC/RagA family TonB-linked outer membrane protein [Niabella sp. CJ426]|uniref:SusC/RagA family TonB-linked outer membrane protein n=1 Tax=Niabella sp. CJ426 TaxID=3393740 RepID=UPI003D040B25
MKKTMQTLLVSLFLSSMALTAWSQQRTVTGTVKDDQGVPLANVSFIVVGTTTGGVTKADGNFSISVNTNNTALEFSSIGYQTKQIVIADSTNLNVILIKNDATGLAEVVVTGFGENRARRNLGYSVTQVNGDDIRRANPINPIAALQGMVPGLQVNPGISGPQSSTRFLIRGSASLDPYGNQPLVVVDDIIMDQDVILPNKGGEQDFGNILKDLNTDDIESISVLKGGAVTALYGSRASNGVILIKTKKGFSQRGLGVTFSQSFLFEKAYKTVDFQNRFGGGANINDWDTLANGTLAINPATYFQSFGPEMNGQIFQDVTGQIRANVPGINDVLSLYQTGLTRNTNLGISGGNEKTTFRFSYSYMDSKSPTPNNKLTRNSYNFRGTHRLSNKILLDINTSYANSDTKNPALQGGNSLLYALSYGVARNYDLGYYEKNRVDTVNGGIRNDESGGNGTGANQAFWEIFENNYRRKEDNLRGNGSIRIDFTDWLRFDGAAAVNYLAHYYTAEKRGKGTGFLDGQYEVRSGSTTTNRYRGSFNITKKVSDFDLLMQLGGELNNSKSNSAYSYTQGGFVYPDVYRLSNSRQNARTEEGTPRSTKLSSAFFQGTVGFKDHTTLNIYGRNDWNSTLVYTDGHGIYSYFYPGADLAFVFSDAFNISKKVLNFGKLRLSYAQVGGGASEPYQVRIPSYAPYSPYVDFGGNSIIRYGLAGNEIIDQNFVPVRNSKLEGGLEFKLFSNRLGGDFTVYTQNSERQIILFDIPSESGAAKTRINGGKLRNAGVELTLYGSPIKKNDFSWDVVFNYTRNRNKLLSLPFGLPAQTLDGGDGIYSVAYVGGDYGTILANYGHASFQALADNTKPLAKDNQPVASPLNGQRVVSINSNGEMIYERAGNYNPKVLGDRNPVVGSTLPKFLGSIRNNFNYKSLTLGVFLDAKIGGDVWSSTYYYGSQYGSLTNTLFGRNSELGGLTYTQNGQQRTDGILLDGVFAQGTTVSAAQSADGQAHNLSGMTVQEAYDKGYVKPVAAASYYNNTYGWGTGIRSMGKFESSWVSLREVSLSYDLPRPITSKVGINSLRLSLIGRNLMFLYNSLPGNLNPDNLSSTSSGAFIENGGTPYFRSYGVSLNATF